MLFNALPYKCVPKYQQGGHALSSDGVDWSSKPRVGAYDTTVQFTDGTSMKCERRERPQMVLDNNGRLVAFSTALTGCPKGLMSGIGDESSIETNARFYKGGDDSLH